jgi:hypothetical protein
VGDAPALAVARRYRRADRRGGGSARGAHVTTAGSSTGVPEPQNATHESEPPGIHDLVTRLRSAADRMVAFSITKTLLRDAATTIEQLEGRLAAQRH